MFKAEVPRVVQILVRCFVVVSSLFINHSFTTSHLFLDARLHNMKLHVRKNNLSYSLLIEKGGGI